VQLTDLGWPVRTERLSHRPATADDVEPTWRFRCLPEVASFTTWEARDLAEYRAQFREPERLAATVVADHRGTVADGAGRDAPGDPCGG
jgi:hypothetical protein